MVVLKCRTDAGVALATAALVTVVLTLGCSPAGRVTTGFYPLGDLEGGGISSLAYDVSGDYKNPVVVGRGLIEEERRAFRWIGGVGMQGLGDFPGWRGETQAFAVSADGAVITGEALLLDGVAFRWTAAGGMEDLGRLPNGGLMYRGRGISANGDTIVGPGRVPGWRGSLSWREDEGLARLQEDMFVNGMSANGEVIVGSTPVPGGTEEAVRWTEAEGMQRLGWLDGGIRDSRALDVSADGTVIVGDSRTPAGWRGFRYDDGRMRPLTGLDGEPGSRAWGVSADGAVMVGQCASSVGPQACVWVGGGSPVSVFELLFPDGTTGRFWRLVSARAITPDHHVIVGRGFNLSGEEEAWLAMVNLEVE